MKSGWNKLVRTAAAWVATVAGGLWTMDAGAAEVRNVTAKYAWPWGAGIAYEVTGTIPDNCLLTVTATDRTRNATNTASTTLLSGDTGSEPGPHRVVWDMDRQGVALQSSDVVFTVMYEPLYCVVDLSGGTNAASYPVTGLDAPPSGGFNTDVYKTTKLVLRRIDPGTFTMGSSSESDNLPHKTTVSKSYYMGLFEVTQKQYQLVTGSNPSSYTGAARPVEKVTYNAIRGSSAGSKWPVGTGVDAGSFLGKLRAKTGLEFDLPTEAQWEYACRAGTSSSYNNGGNSASDLKQLGRYSGDTSDGKGGYSSQHTKVGSYKPNAWGLYDMHGNVWEMCLDWYGSLSGGVTDPTGPSSGSDRVVRGGNWDSAAANCTSARRDYRSPSDANNKLGFRLVRSLSPGVIAGTSAPVEVRSPGTLDVEGHAVIDVWPFAAADDEYGTKLGDTVLYSATLPETFDWQPQTLGAHTLTCFDRRGDITNQTVNVKSLAFAVPNAPNPPTAADPNISITPVTRNFGIGGGGGAILVTGSGTWQASASDSWITLGAASGEAGYPVTYTVSATAQVEGRTGYVYVSGHVHTVTQDGLGATISPENATFETEGGAGTIAVAAPDRMGWQARANVDWIRVEPTSGTGAGSVTYTVAPFNEARTRQGTLTVAGQTFTVFQYGRRIKLSPVKAEYDYLTHVIPVTVDALALTEWTVEPQNSWISVVDAGSGKGSDLVTLAIAENPSWSARTGTVKIGTETFTVVQQGRTALEFDIDPKSTTASVNGANGRIAVMATPDLPWSAASQANWLTIYAQTATGAGNGNVSYSVSPNPTLYDRTGTITVTPGNPDLAAKTHSVTQPAAVSALSANGYEFEAVGESCEVTVSLADIVQWSVDNLPEWLTVSGATNRVGPGTVVLQAAPNDTVYSRSGTVTIARKPFKVVQKARGVEVEYESKLFNTDGGMESISVHPDGQVDWTAVSSDTSWITIFAGASGTGDGEVIYIVAPYVGDGASRTGSITIGDKEVWITQRAYELSIDPKGAVVAGNNGAGEFGVSAGIDDVWSAIVTEPWITLVENYDSVTGSGTVRFLYTDNDTGKTRTGKIIVAGEVYTLEQRARQMVAVTAGAEHGGNVDGGGTYDLGTEVTLTAIPDSGYAFSYWTGAVESMENPLKVRADVPKTYTAVFEPLPIEFEFVLSDTNGVTLGWNNLAWATHYVLYRGITSVPSSATELVDIPNTGNCTYFDGTGDVGVEYWYWIGAEGLEDDKMSEPMTGRKQKPAVISPIVYENLMGAENPNPATYQEGTTVTFENPGPVTGYVFAGWTPPQITAGMTGTQTVAAAWTPNRYSIAYDPNGGSGVMEPTACTYDQAVALAANGFVRSGWRFDGWGTAATSGAVYAEGQIVTNLTAVQSGVVTLFAAWKPLEVATPVIVPEDGSVFVGESCEVSISCATEGALIYFTTDGTTPRVAEAFLYAGPFAITETATIKALAVAEGEKSGYATTTITRWIPTLAEAAGAPELEFATGGDAEWAAVEDPGAPGGLSARSGTVAANGESWMEARVEGPGTFRFDWRVECEHDETGDATWDHLAVAVDGGETQRIDGTTEWVRVRLVLEGEGEHRVRWTFAKDGYDDEGSALADAGWVSGVMWLPDSPGDAFPSVGSDEEVSAALDGAADARLSGRIGTLDAYDDFRAWMAAKGLEQQAVMASAHAWPSYALGTGTLFANEPAIRLGDVALKGRGTRATGDGTALEVSVTVRDGEDPVAVDAAKVAALFEATGDVFDWSGENRLPAKATQTGANGMVLFFRVVPGDGSAPKAFIRLLP